MSIPRGRDEDGRALAYEGMGHHRAHHGESAARLLPGGVWPLLAVLLGVRRLERRAVKCLHAGELVKPAERVRLGGEPCRHSLQRGCQDLPNRAVIIPPYCAGFKGVL